MPTEKQKQLVEQMIVRVKKLKKLGYSNKQLEKIVVDLDLPLGAHLHILRSVNK
jgi:Holliday junction resolvasome RuvABC DNA-binding subunit